MLYRNHGQIRQHALYSAQQRHATRYQEGDDPPMIEDRPGRETTVRLPHRSINDRRRRPVTTTGDNRASVELWDDSCPLPIRLYFAHIGDDAPLLGVEVGSEAH